MGFVQNLLTLSAEGLALTEDPGLGRQAALQLAELLTRPNDPNPWVYEAFRRANRRSWQALELALTGENWQVLCEQVFTRSEDREFGQLIQTYLDHLAPDTLPFESAGEQVHCLEELRSLRRKDMLDDYSWQGMELAWELRALCRLKAREELEQALEVARRRLAGEFGWQRYSLMGRLWASNRAAPLLVGATRYFFRREADRAPDVPDALRAALRETMPPAPGLRELAAALDRDEELFSLVCPFVMDYLADLAAVCRDLRIPPGVVGIADGLSVSSNAVLQRVMELVNRYRTLPEAARQRLPAMLNGVGKLEVAAGAFPAAQKDFQLASSLLDEPTSKSEAHYNLFMTHLQTRQWKKALLELRTAYTLAPARFAPFPLDQYEPERILGAGSSGIAFLAKTRDTDEHVVIKSLWHDDAEGIFEQARALRRLDHPVLPLLLDLGDQAALSSPERQRLPSRRRLFLVWEYFPGLPLDEYVREKGPLGASDVAELCRQIADGLHAAHQRGIVHGCLKPSNVLVARDGDDWQVRLIDFQASTFIRSTLPSGRTWTDYKHTLLGNRMLVALDYLAPEQCQVSEDLSHGASADLFACARVCCFAFFETPVPAMKDWRQAPASMVKFLRPLLNENPAERPATAAELLTRLQDWQPQSARIKEFRFSQWEITIEPMAPPPLSDPEMPSLAEDFQMLLAHQRGLTQAIEQVEDESHPSLQPAFSALTDIWEQWQERDAQHNETRAALSAAELAELDNAIAAACSQDKPSKRGSTTPVTPKVKAVLDQWQQVARARKALENAQQEYEGTRRRQIAVLRQQLEELAPRLDCLHNDDFCQVMEKFCAALPPDEPFPEHAWARKWPAMRERGYPWDEAESHARALAFFHARQTEEKIWRDVHARAEAEGYQGYLAAYPNGRYHDDARGALRSLAEAVAWRTARQRHTHEGYLEYLQTHEDGGHASDAQEFARELGDRDYWRRAQRADDASGYQEYLRRFRRGEHADEAFARLRQIEEALWQFVIRHPTLDLCERYLAQFPEGDHATDIVKIRQELPDNEAWRKASADDTIMAYDAYLAHYPVGKHAAAARERKASLGQQRARNRHRRLRWEQIRRLSGLGVLGAILGAVAGSLGIVIGVLMAAGTQSQTSFSLQAIKAILANPTAPAAIAAFLGALAGTLGAGVRAARLLVQLSPQWRSVGIVVSSLAGAFLGSSLAAIVTHALTAFFPVPRFLLATVLGLLGALISAERQPEETSSGTIWAGALFGGVTGFYLVVMALSLGWIDARADRFSQIIALHVGGAFAGLGLGAVLGGVFVCFVPAHVSAARRAVAGGFAGLLGAGLLQLFGPWMMGIVGGALVGATTALGSHEEEAPPPERVSRVIPAVVVSS